MSDARESRRESYEHVLLRIHAVRSQVEIDPPGGRPKAKFTMVLVLRSEELGGTAYMGVQPTHGAVQDSHSSRS